MADKKISALTAATTPLAGTEVLPIVQSGSTVKVAVSDLTAGRTPTMNGANVRSANAIRFYRGDNAIYSEIYNTTGGGGGCVLNNQNSDGFSFQNGGVTQVKINDLGNVVITTAGKGIDFSANGGDVLTQYDEGTWTPSVGGNATYSSRSGRYTRIGNVVHIQGSMQVNVLGTGSTTTISGLPFVSAQRGGGGMTYFASLSQAVSFLSPVAEGSVVTFEGITVASSGTTDGIAIFRNGAYVVFSATYFV